MLYYLDSVIVIYAVEGIAADQQRARTHLTTLEQAGNRFVIGELTRTECLVPVFGPGGGARLLSFYRFFHQATVRTVALTAAMHARAAAIRGGHYYPARPAVPPRRYSLADALHLAAAIESGCDRFLTNDNPLSNFTDILVEELPP